MLDELTAYADVPLTAEELPCAYVLKHKKSGMMYVGSTHTPARRRTVHMSQLKRGVHHSDKLQAAFEDDKAFDFVIYTTDDRDAAYQLEQALIDHYLPTGKLLNVSSKALDPLSGYELNEVQKQRRRTLRLGAKSSPEHVAKISAALTGRKCDPAVAEAISAKLKGRPVSQEHADHLREISNAKKKKVMVDGVLYDGVRVCSRAIDVEQSVVRHRLKSNNPKFVNWHYL